VQHFRDGRLLLDKFGHPILWLRSGPFSVDTLAHAEQFLGLDSEDSIAAPPQFAIALTAVKTEDAAKHPTIPPWVKPGLPSWGPHVRFSRAQAMVLEGSPLVKPLNFA
jgi:hypothetical protein